MRMPILKTRSVASVCGMGVVCVNSVSELEHFKCNPKLTLPHPKEPGPWGGGLTSGVDRHDVLNPRCLYIDLLFGAVETSSDARISVTLTEILRL